MSFKDTMGRYRTQSLFHEFRTITPEYKPLWTLKDEPVNGLPSLKALYLSCGDPTEYSFAKEAFGSWNQWLKIKASKALAPYIEDWPTELEIKLKSEGLRGIITEALEGGKSSFNAAKYLANGDWNKGSTRGRPSKAEVEKNLKIAAKMDAEFADDATRIGLSVINGGK
jgi:hypothetical protein